MFFETVVRVAKRPRKFPTAPIGLLHLRALDGNVALFSHGQFGSVLAVGWVGLPLVSAQHFPLGTASLSILGFDDHHPEVPVIARWNAAHNGGLSASA